MRRRVGVVGLVGLAAMAMVVSVAWACTAISAVYSINPSAAPAGTTVVVTGANFHPRAVEIRWNTVDGPVIGTTRGPDFEAQAQVPSNAVPGHYRVFATQEGSLNPEISFRVVAPQSAASNDSGDPAAPRSVGGGDDVVEPSYFPGAESSGPDGASSHSAPTSPATASSSSGSGRGGRGPTGPSSPPRPGGDSTNSAASSAASPPSPTANAAALPAPPATPEDQPGQAVPGSRSAFGELSFASPWKPENLRGADNLNQPANQRQATPGLGGGLALIGLGLGGLVAATTVAGLRRRRLAVGSDHHGQRSL